MLSCLKGRLVLLSGLVCLGLAGCGIKNPSIHSGHGQFPPTNVQVAEKVIEQALENMGIPEGHGLELLCVVEGDGIVSDMVRIVAPEVFLGKDYVIVEKNASVAELRLTVDSLQVTLASEQTVQMGKSIRRFAEARIGAVLLDTAGTRQVYRGKGTFEDSFASDMLQVVNDNDMFVNDLVSNNRLMSKFKPVVIGLVLTVFSWMLYSYRG